ncbi:MAG TPA: 2-oxoglutarate dehydrogenase complex dihydrolipoyllysine-residue succinyltransferase, partial [Alphaproteobacteria bacterium]|nr:2-oxoglutarate dehydrogenase complex dihydrolipoyllysine-residue succinyltransferase [Alphaproteobacteria bacterium]
LVELETDKVAVEVNAKSAGTLSEILAQTGAEVKVGGLLGRIAEGAGAAASRPAPAKAPITTTPVSAPKMTPPPTPPTHTEPKAPAVPLAPAVRKIVEDNRLDPTRIPATGKDGRLTKGDVLSFLETKAPAPASAPAARAPETGAREERVKMSRLRRRIAERLKEAQNTAAMLTTFNEVDMSAVMHLRAVYRDAFEKKYGMRLGFMGFFVKACIQALKEIPEVNAEIQGDELVYKNHYDIGVAVGTEQGLVVPVVRDADRLSLAEVEGTIAALGKKARDGKLAIEDMAGGTFTISNGGVYGSLLSTPILNPPQSGILGMHKIQERPMVEKGQVVVRPMMYLALSYDHRVVDGRGAVTFLVRVKECIEDPTRILLDI